MPAGSPCLSDPNFVPIMARVPYKNVGAHSDADYYFFNASYQALQARLNKRFSQGFQFMLNYTWSKTLDEGSEIEHFNGDFNHPQDPYHLYNDYGLSQLDQAHRLVVSYSYALPVGKGRRWSLGPADYVLGGWNHSGILTFATGLPFTVFCCNSGVDQFGDKYQQRLRANVNGDPTKNFNQSVHRVVQPQRVYDSATGHLRQLGSRHAARAGRKASRPRLHERHARIRRAAYAPVPGGNLQFSLQLAQRNCLSRKPHDEQPVELHTRSQRDLPIRFACAPERFGRAEPMDSPRHSIVFKIFLLTSRDRRCPRTGRRGEENAEWKDENS